MGSKILARISLDIDISPASLETHWNQSFKSVLVLVLVYNNEKRNILV